MMPEEAVNNLIAKGLISHMLWPKPNAKELARNIIDACVVTAKAEAKADETRRCAGLILDAGDTDTGYGWLADKILHTGGLERDE